MPLLYHNLSSIAPEALPPSALAQLRGYFYANARYCFHLIHELLELLDLFHAHGIPAIPYKGPVLAASIYGNPLLRQAGDLDILVPEGDVPQARRLLLARGYTQTWPQIPLSASQEAAHLRAKYDIKFTHRTSGVTVELHWSITPKYIAFPPDPRILWDHLEHTYLTSKEVPSFPPEDLLLLLCAHGANHCWVRLGWLCDIAELIRAEPDLDWERVLAKARLWRAERMLFIGLTLAHDLLEAALPKAILREARSDGTASSLAVQVSKRFVSAPMGWLGPFEEPLFHLRMREHLRDQVWYCLHMAAPTVKDWAFVRLPASLSFLYYLIRPFRLIVAHGLKLVRFPRILPPH